VVCWGLTRTQRSTHSFIRPTKSGGFVVAKHDSLRSKMWSVWQININIATGRNTNTVAERQKQHLCTTFLGQIQTLRIKFY
jgi:hypothetical protein